jgi:DNA polymerase-3 subunit delta'
MPFFEILGHSDIIQGLAAALAEGRSGHAYLFFGPEGIGKKTVALALAESLLCLAQTTDSSCDCSSCRRFRSGNHPDLMTVEAAGGSIKIEQLRELQRTAYFKPLLSPRKVFFFPEADKLTEAAANSFLKILEEPPAGVVFIFTAVRPDYILPTIRSRCQNYQLFPVPAAEIARWLEKRGFPAAEAELRSRICEGIPGRALNSVTERTGTGGTDIMALLNADRLKRLIAVNGFEKKERQEMLVILRFWQEQLRAELLKRLEERTLDRARVARLQTILEKLVGTVRMVESNVNIRLALDDLIMAFDAPGMEKGFD